MLQKLYFDNYFFNSTYYWFWHHDNTTYIIRALIYDLKSRLKFKYLLTLGYQHFYFHSPWFMVSLNFTIEQQYIKNNLIKQI